MQVIIETDKITTVEEARACLEGFSLISNKLQNSLAGLGVTKIIPVGEDFDPEIHEAFAMGVGLPENRGKIIECIQPGYSLEGKMIRFAKVIVGQ